MYTPGSPAQTPNRVSFETATFRRPFTPDLDAPVTPGGHEFANIAGLIDQTPGITLFPSFAINIAPKTAIAAAIIKGAIKTPEQLDRKLALIDEHIGQSALDGRAVSVVADELDPSQRSRSQKGTFALRLNGDLVNAINKERGAAARILGIGSVSRNTPTLSIGQCRPDKGLRLAGKVNRSILPVDISLGAVEAAQTTVRLFGRTDNERRFMQLVLERSADQAQDRAI